MIKTNSQAGGEGSSGGFILPEFNYCRDGILTSGFIASMLGQENFESALKFFEKYQQVREKVSIEAPLHDKTLEKLTEKMSNQYTKVITIDGIKAIVDENSWVLVRKSNTEDIIRISGESDNAEKVKTIVEQIRDLVKQSYDEAK